VGPRAVLEAVLERKIPGSRRESNPRTPIVQPVAQRYTDSAIKALTVVTECTKLEVNMYYFEGLTKVAT
jgi:hypothetical protein